MKVGIKWHIRAWITDIIVGSGNGWLTGIVVPIHSQLVVKKNLSLCEGKKRGHSEPFLLGFGKEKLPYFTFCERTLNSKMSSGLRETSLKYCFSPVGIQNILTAAFTAIHTTWKILLCTLDVFSAFQIPDWGTEQKENNWTFCLRQKCQGFTFKC